MRVLHQELTEKKNYFLYRSVLILSRGRVTRPSQRWQVGGSQGDPWFERILRGMKEQLQGNIRNSALPTPAVLPVQNLPTHRNWLLIMPTVFKMEFKKQNWSENRSHLAHTYAFRFSTSHWVYKEKSKKRNLIELSYGPWNTGWLNRNHEEILRAVVHSFPAVSSLLSHSQCKHGGKQEEPSCKSFLLAVQSLKSTLALSVSWEDRDSCVEMVSERMYFQTRRLLFI